MLPYFVSTSKGGMDRNACLCKEVPTCRRVFPIPTMPSLETTLSKSGHELGFGNHMAVHERLAGCFHNFGPEF